VRWEAGETRDVELVPFGGRQAIYGFNGLVNGPINARTKETALARTRYLGYLDSASEEG
jgi:urease subunit beta